MDIKPGPLEVRSQLRVLLGRERLIKSPSQAAVLEVIVTKWLANDIMNEKTIGERAFANFTPGNSTDVRINVFNLRKSLAEYYAAEGSMDLVIIEILKGRKYGVSVSYNPRADAARLYEGALAMMGDVDSYPWLVVSAITNCFEAMKLNPQFAFGHALYAELVLCYGTIRRGDLSKYGVGPMGCKNKEIRIAREYALRALRLDRKCWRGWLALGICHACEHRWERAGQLIHRALGFAPASVKGDPWYVIYLMAAGNSKEAIGIAREKWKNTPPRSIWKAILLLLLYVSPEEAKLTWTERFEWSDLDWFAGDCFLLTAVNGLVGLRWGGVYTQESLTYFQRMYEKTVRSVYHAMGSSGLWAMLAGLKGDRDFAQKKARFIAMPKHFTAVWSHKGHSSLPADFSRLSNLYGTNPHFSQSLIFSSSECLRRRGRFVF